MRNDVAISSEPPAILPSGIAERQQYSVCEKASPFAGMLFRWRAPLTRAGRAGFRRSSPFLPLAGQGIGRYQRCLRIYSPWTELRFAHDVITDSLRELRHRDPAVV